jgi:hypothetical protein
VVEWQRLRLDRLKSLFLRPSAAAPWSRTLTEILFKSFDEVIDKVSDEEPQSVRLGRASSSYGVACIAQNPRSQICGLATSWREAGCDKNQGSPLR